MDINEALRALESKGRRIGQTYTNHDGMQFVIVDDVAMRYPHAVALAEGRATMQDVLADIERANASRPLET